LKLRAKKLKSRQENGFRSVQRHRGVTARHVNPEGRQPGGDRPFIGESRSASLGQQQSFAKVGFRVRCQMIGARLTAGVALASTKLWLPFVHEAGSHRDLRSRFISRT
jgi:hypothetical protein